MARQPAITRSAFLQQHDTYNAPVIALLRVMVHCCPVDPLDHGERPHRYRAIAHIDVAKVLRTRMDGTWWVDPVFRPRHVRSATAFRISIRSTMCRWSCRKRTAPRARTSRCCAASSLPSTEFRQGCATAARRPASQKSLILSSAW